MSAICIWYQVVVSAVILMTRIQGQFPAYFFSQQSSLAPPNCVCSAGQSGSQNTGNVNYNNNNLNNVNNPTNNVNFPNNFPNNNVNYPNNNINYPNNNFPSNGVPAPINTFATGNNFNNNPYNNNNNWNNQAVISPNVQVDRRPNRRQVFNINYPSSARICGTDGNVYSDVCLIINAQYQNPNLGGRPCNLQAAVQTAQQSSSVNNNVLSNQLPVCMNDGSTQQSATAALSVMLNSPGLGIKCEGQCPCQLSCPPTVGSNQNSHNGDCFNHWSFYHGSRGSSHNNRPGRPNFG